MGDCWVLPEELRQLAETDDGLVKEVLSVFQSDSAERIAALRTAFERNDRATVKGQAHALKGSAGQVGASEVFSLSREIEQTAGAAEPAALRDLVTRLEAAFAQVCREMSA